MIDNFSLALTHGLLILAAWRLLSRNDLDRDGDPGKKERLRGRRDTDSRDA